MNESMNIRFRFAMVLSSVLFLPGASTGAPIARELKESQWPMPAQNYASTRFSPLDEINPQNAARLKVSWTFDLGSGRGALAAPLVVGTTMYVAAPHAVYALELTPPRGDRGSKWAYKPQPASSGSGSEAVIQAACFADGRVFLTTLDGYTIAVDAASGQEIWKTQVADREIGETITMAPVVASGKVLVGNKSAETSGWLKALDAASGQVLWTAGDGPVSGWISYDPHLNLIYYGSAAPESGDPKFHSSGNKWTCGVFARDPDTGNARWFHRLSPLREFDPDGVSENILTDLPLSRGIRQVLLRAERNGYVCVLDRTTGDAISATPIVQGASSQNRQPAAYSPRTQLLYIPHQTLAKNSPVLALAAGMSDPPRSSGNGTHGLFTAWDPMAKKAVWSLQEPFPIRSGTLVTGGDVVFYATMDGKLKAVNARTGKPLWKWAADTIGQPMTYRGPDGKQYVAVLAGKKDVTLYAFALP
jgi:lanthanide-dependent methanol dehydrogenase